MIAVCSSFWEDFEDWPLDTPEYIFLGRAINRLGRAEFGSRWDFEPPENPNDDSEEAFEEWESADNKAQSEAEDMLRTVEKRVADWARDGTLCTAVRAKEGGSLVDQPRDIWNFENWQARLNCCVMSLKKPFATSDWDVPTHYIYVKLDSLNQCLQLVAAKERPKRSRANKLAATIEAITAIWGARGPPSSLGSQDVLKKVNHWLGAEKRGSTSRSTLERALKQMKIHK
jgi:hypothetical protein